MTTAAIAEGVGHPINRVDGIAKATGTAHYAAEHDSSDLLQGIVVSSAIARGRINNIECSGATAVPGVIAVLTHENVPLLDRSDVDFRDDVAPPGSPFRPLQSNEVRFAAQPIALVLADNLESARYAAARLRVEYEEWSPCTNLEAELTNAGRPAERDGMAPPEPRGDAIRAFADAALRLEVTYRVPPEYHNPMEPFATTVVYEADGRLTVYDKTQGVQNVRNYLCSVFGMSPDDITVKSPYVGGAFGSGLRPQYQVFLAVLAARLLRRSIRVTLTRPQMFSFGHRPQTIQRIAIGATSEGKLQSIIHQATAETSRFEDYSEMVTNWSALLYECANVACRHDVVPLDVYTPLDMRAPGAAWGVYALESALDEMAVLAACDPIQLRLRNYAETDQVERRPFSSKNLRECYAAGTGIRMGSPGAPTSIDGRRSQSNRLGNVRRNLGSSAAGGDGQSHVVVRRSLDATMCHSRYRHWHLHGDEADCRI